ncbi:MAG TPA: carboxymuconolactone decarboxylase family protein, partial [Anaerolineae bacterium]
MTFIRLVETDEVPPEVRAIFESGEQRHGQVLNAWRAVAHNPAVFQAYVPYLMAVFGPGALNQRIKDLIAVRIALLNHCRYTVSHRVVAARKQGISDKDLIGLLNPPDYDYSPAEQAALAFAGELTTGVAGISCADNPQ